jgi:hypothetical protein
MTSPVPHPFAPRFEHAFTIAITLKPAMFLRPSGTGQTRAAVYVDSGTVEGKINGVVLPMSGGDWALVRADRVLDFDARYMLELDDGTIVYMQNRGFRWGSEDAMARMARNEPVNDDEYYMRVTPRFEVAEGQHDWLNRHVFVGVAEKTPGANRIHYFQVL